VVLTIQAAAFSGTLKTIKIQNYTASQTRREEAVDIWILTFVQILYVYHFVYPCNNHAYIVPCTISITFFHPSIFLPTR
jgi:hypothetical protein